MRLWIAAAALLLAGFGLLETSHAEVRVEVLDTYPAGPDILLPRNQNFQLRLAYASDQPVGIWITPYFRGARVDVGSSPSPKLVGDRVLVGGFMLAMGAGLLAVAWRGRQQGELPVGASFLQAFRPNRKDNPLAFHFFLALYFCGGMAMAVWGLLALAGMAPPLALR